MHFNLEKIGIYGYVLTASKKKLGVKFLFQLLPFCYVS